MSKLCKFESCRKRATYGINCNPLKCFEHKELLEVIELYYDKSI